MTTATKTKTELQMSLDRLKREIGTAADAWELDYYSIGGGYRIMSGGFTPMGANRRSAQEMISAMDAALDAVRFVLREYEMDTK